MSRVFSALVSSTAVLPVFFALLVLPAVFPEAVFSELVFFAVFPVSVFFAAVVLPLVLAAGLPPYARVLAANARGRALLRELSAAGERIGAAAVRALRYYGVERIRVVR